MKLFIRSALYAFRHSPVFAAYVTAFLTFIIFDILWCNQTTFRAMSNPALYTNALLAASVVTLPFALIPRRWLHVVVLLLVSAMMTSVLMYCRTYFRAIPLESYAIAGNLADFLPSVVDSFSPAYLNLLWPTVLFLFFGRRRRSGRGSQKRVTSSERVTGFMIVFAATAILAGGVMALQGGFFGPYRKMKNACYYSTCTTPVYALYGDLIYEMANRRTEPTASDLGAIEAWLDTQERSASWRPDSIPERNSVVMIICESLESFPLGKTIEGHELTPFLNSLIADSATFFAPRMLTQVGSGRSIDFQLLSNAGLLPMVDDVYSMSYFDRRYLTLNQALAEKNGARSMILTCDKPVTWNQAPVAEAFRIDTLLDKSSWKNDETVGNPPKLSDGSFMRQIVERFTESDLWPVGHNRFVEIVTYSGHSPFRLPDQLRTFGFSGAIPPRLADYLTMANYTDGALNTIVDYLKSRPDYKDMIVVITGDHEGLANWRKEILATAAGSKIVDSGQFTPLIVLNSPVAGRFDRVAGQVDIYPTLLDMLGLGGYKWRGIGRSLLDPSHPGYAIATLTGEVAGDTAGIAPAAFDHMVQARLISDKIIKFNYLDNYKNSPSPSNGK